VGDEYKSWSSSLYEVFATPLLPRPS
jgi:hypothetical protein